MDVRTYQTRDDLAPLLAFASRICRARAPLRAGWHPGDLTWGLKGAYDRAGGLTSWTVDGEVRALVQVESPGRVYLDVAPGHEDLLAPAVAWAQAEAPDGLSVWVMENDHARIAALEGLGFRRAGPEGVQFCLDLAELPPPADVAGFRVRDSVGVDPEVRARAHRDAWNDLAHLGIAAQSSFSAEIYESLRGAPGYDPTLDLLVEGPDGALVATALCWADEASGVGLFEPVGTASGFRGRRLARLAIHEALRRLKARGHRWARVGTAHANAAAIAAYVACGFELDAPSAWWTAGG